MIHLMIMYDVVNIFSMKNYKSSRKLRGGPELVPGRELVHHHYCPWVHSEFQDGGVNKAGSINSKYLVI